MKTIENTVAFGNFKPGDQLLIPDNAEFDNSYFKLVTPPDDKPVVTPVVPNPEVDVTVNVEVPSDGTKPEVEVTTTEPETKE